MLCAPPRLLAPLLLLLARAPTAAGDTLVNFGTSCSTSPIQTQQLFGSSTYAAIEFQAAAASAVQIQTLELCLGGGAWTGSLTVALFNTQTSGSYLPTTQIGAATSTSSISVAASYAPAMKSLTLTTPLTVPAGSARYALAFWGPSSSIRWASVGGGASLWTWGLLRRATPCADPCNYKFGTGAWSVQSASLGFSVGGVALPSASPSATPSASPSPSPSPTPSRPGGAASSAALPSLAASLSASGSASRQASASAQPSPTLSRSVRASRSAPASASASTTLTLTQSVSATGASAQPSRSPSASAPASPSPSPPLSCPAGSQLPPGAAACAPCPGGHYCAAGAPRRACGRGSFCPDGSAAPAACPLQVPPAGGWGAQLVQGPAFVVETAHCLNHCFWNFSAGADGLLSRC